MKNYSPIQFIERWMCPCLYLSLEISKQATNKSSCWRQTKIAFLFVSQLLLKVTTEPEDENKPINPTFAGF